MWSKSLSIAVHTSLRARLVAGIVITCIYDMMHYRVLSNHRYIIPMPLAIQEGDLPKPGLHLTNILECVNSNDINARRYIVDNSSMP